jgi:hypothetical protein
MTKEQIKKLVELQEQKERVLQIRLSVEKGERFEISCISGNGYGAGQFRTVEIPALTSELKDLLSGMVGDYLEEITATIESLVLCTRDMDEIKYKPTEI